MLKERAAAIAAIGTRGEEIKTNSAEFLWVCRRVKPPPLPDALSGLTTLSSQSVFLLGYAAPIHDIDESSINFGGRQIVDYGFRVAIMGNIDRVTGRMDSPILTLPWSTTT